MCNKKFIVMAYADYEGWWVDFQTDDFEEAISAHKEALFFNHDALLVSPVNYTTIKDERQLDMFEEAQT